MQAYSDPEREHLPHALPDLDVFHATIKSCPLCDRMHQHEPAGGQPAPNECDCGESLADEPAESGWFWQSCFPGCMADSDPYGPFATYDEALADARADVRE